MAPPLVSAAIRAPRRGRSIPLTLSRWTYAILRPRPVVIPSETSSSTSSYASSGGGVGGRLTDEKGRPPPPILASILRPATSSRSSHLLRRRHLGDDLLGQDVEGGHRSDSPVEIAGPHGGQQGGALDQLVAAERVEDAVGDPRREWLERPTRWRKVAMLRGEPTWHTSSTGPMSIPSSSEAVATSALSSPARSRSSTRWRRSFDRLPWWAATCSEPKRSASRWAKRSDIRRVLTKTRVVRWSATWAAIRSRTSPSCSVEATADSSVPGSSMETCRSRRWPQSTTVADRPVPTPVSRRAVVDRTLGGGQPDPLGPGPRGPVETLEGEGQVGAPFVPDQGVDLVHDHRLGGGQHGAAPGGGDQEVERLGGGHQDGGWSGEHGGAGAGRGIPGPDGRP